MSNKDCGCNKQAQEGEYLLVAATGNQAAQCGNPLDQDPRASCSKQEEMFDYSLSDFLVPQPESFTSMEVCNASVYSIGMWLEFFNPSVILQISNISGNIISLVNRCPNGEPPYRNPSIGTVVNRNTKFVVASQPFSMSDEEAQEFIEDALSNSEEICVPSLLATSTTATVHPVGRIEDDPSNLGVKKCLKRIFGILFKAGRPYLSALGSPVGPIATGYRRLVRRNSDGALFAQQEYHEASNVAAGRQYALSISKGKHRIIGPAYIPSFYFRKLYENTASDNYASWPTFSNNTNKDFDLSGYGEVQSLSDVLDHYYVMVRLEFSVRSTSTFRTCNAFINGRLVAKVGTLTDDQPQVQYNSVTVPIKVLKSDNKITVRFECPGTVNYYYRLEMDGIFE